MQRFLRQQTHNHVSIASRLLPFASNSKLHTRVTLEFQPAFIHFNRDRVVWLLAMSYINPCYQKRLRNMDIRVHSKNWHRLQINTKEMVHGAHNLRHSHATWLSVFAMLKVPWLHHLTITHLHPRSAPCTEHVKKTVMFFHSFLSITFWKYIFYENFPFHASF